MFENINEIIFYMIDKCLCILLVSDFPTTPFKQVPRWVWK